MQIHQGPNKAVHNFRQRFNKEIFKIFDLHITTTVSALAYAIKCEAFKMSLLKTSPKSVTDLLTRTEKYINMEKTMFSRRDVPSSSMLDQKRPHESNLRWDLSRIKPRQDPLQYFLLTWTPQDLTFWWKSKILKNSNGFQGCELYLAPVIKTSTVIFIETTTHGLGLLRSKAWNWNSHQERVFGLFYQ